MARAAASMPASDTWGSMACDSSVRTGALSHAPCRARRRMHRRSRGGLPAPDFAALPAPGADAQGPVDHDEAVTDRVHAPGDVPFAKAGVTEGAFEGRVWSAALDTAEANSVALLRALFVFEVANQVVELRSAPPACTDCLVAFFDVAMLLAERAATVLAAVDGGASTAKETAAELAVTRHERVLKRRVGCLDRVRTAERGQSIVKTVRLRHPNARTGTVGREQ